MRTSPCSEDPNAGVKAALLQLLNKEEVLEKERLGQPVTADYSGTHSANSYTDTFRNNERRDAQLSGRSLLDSSASHTMGQARTLPTVAADYPVMRPMQFTADQDHRFNFSRVTLPALVTGAAGTDRMATDTKAANYSYNSMPTAALPTSSVPTLIWALPTRGSGFNRAPGRVPTRGGRGRGGPY